jgi:succinoglycan biosynthesis transport protein ExoP
MKQNVTNNNLDIIPNGADLSNGHAIYPPPGMGGWNGEIQDNYPAFGEQRPDAFGLAQVLGIWTRRKYLFLSVVGVMLVFALYRAVTSPRVYRATATLQLDSSSSDWDRSSPVLSTLLGGGADKSTGTQIEILKAPQVQRAAIDKMSEAEKQRLGSFAVDIKPKDSTNIVEISVSSSNPQGTADLANAIGTEFIALSENKNRGQLQGARRYIENQLTRVRGQLENSRTRLKEYKEQNNVLDPGKEADLLSTRMAEIDSTLQAARAKRDSDEAQLKALRGVARQTSAGSVVPERIVRKPAVTYLQDQLTKLEVELVQARLEFTANSPEVREKEGRIAQLRRQIANQAQTTVESWVRQPNELRSKVLQDIAQLQSQVWANEATIAAYERSKTALGQRIGVLPKREFDLTRMSNEALALQTTYDQLNAQYQTLQINEQARAAAATMVFAAEVPGGPIGPNRGMIIIQGLLFGLLIGIALAVVVDRLDDHIHTDTDIEQATQLPVLGYIPHSPVLAMDQEDATLLQNHADGKHPAILDTFRLLRSSINFCSYNTKLNCILVTSAVPNDGKSSVTLNLAVAAAMNGEKVLLIDCDLRRPSLHQRCGLPNAVGFSNIAAGMVSLEEAVHETPVPNLKILTSGPVPPDPYRLINSPASRQVFEAAVKEYDFVIVDTAPLWGIGDAQILATMVDGTIVVASPQRTRKREIARTVEILLQTRSNILGVVMNNVNSAFSGNYQHYHTYGLDEKDSAKPTVPGRKKPQQLNR